MKTLSSAECGVRSAESRQLPASRRFPAGARPTSERSAFTMIEIAISLAVIGFALVAIIGILPLGMNVQRENREDTIINQDASVLINALRSGARQMDDLTNYVKAITNFVTVYAGSNGSFSQSIRGYTYNQSIEDGVPTDPQFGLTNGYRIIGLLGTPKIIPQGGGSFISNYIVATVRSLSGPVSEKPPQIDAAVQDLALNYRVICEVSAYGPNFYDPLWTNFTLTTLPPAEVVNRSNYMRLVQNYEQNLREVRLTFRWPILPNGDLGPGRQVFRTMVSGALLNTNQFGFPIGKSNLYFFQSRAYVKAP